MPHLKFDLAKLERLNDEGRFEELDPERMWVALGSPEPSVIVEIGAGTGLFAGRFAAMAPDATVFAVDVEPVMIEWMREHRSEVAAGRIVPVLSGEAHVPLDDGLADLVVMINLHHELVDPASTYAEARRVLRSGGQILLVDWAPIETPKGPPQQVRASAEDLAGRLTAAGFAAVTVHPSLPWHSLLTARVPGEGREEADAYAAFLARHPEYAATADLDAMREADYGRLDRLGHVYLDYTGGGLYAVSQLRRHLELLDDNVLGNPHSHNPTSLASTRLVDEARASVLEFFRASPEEYDVVFTSNASGALKLVGESYPFGPGDRYVLSYDNHNSVNGIREFARSRGASVTYLPVGDPELRLDPEMVARDLANTTPGHNHLFAYPAQSNFSGVQHPLGMVAEAQELGWDVILDCAAYAPTNRLDLSVVRPDFVPLSFYKMFGYPTGIGALIAKRETLAKLRRPWFAGGTITLASVQGEGWHHLIPGSSGFEDGTVDYLGLPAVRIGLEHLSSVGVESIHDRVVALASWLLQEMTSLAHSDGAPMVRVFGPTDMEYRGGTIAFYLLDPAGVPYDVHLMEELAGRERISLRTGCFCNPGDGEVAHHITRDEMAGCFVGKARPVTFSECHEIIQDTTGKMPNTMRVSLGLASNFADVWRFMLFAAGFRDVPASDVRA